MRDRLIELIRKAKKTTKDANCDLEREMLFADYLLANGVIVPPCKVGDTVYWRCLAGIFEVIVTGNGIFVETKSNTDFHFRYEDIGRIIFLSREEAEAALKGPIDDN